MAIRPLPQGAGQIGAARALANQVKDVKRPRRCCIGQDNRICRPASLRQYRPSPGEIRLCAGMLEELKLATRPAAGRLTQLIVAEAQALA
jgi:hypothetical protein